MTSASIRCSVELVTHEGSCREKTMCLGSALVCVLYEVGGWQTVTDGGLSIYIEMTVAAIVDLYSTLTSLRVTKSKRDTLLRMVEVLESVSCTPTSSRKRVGWFYRTTSLAIEAGR